MVQKLGELFSCDRPDDDTLIEWALCPRGSKYNRL